MADSTQFDFKMLESLGTALMCRVEEELVSMTYGITRLLKQGLETQQQFQSYPSDWSKSDRPNGFEQMMNNINSLLNQIEQRGREVTHEFSSNGNKAVRSIEVDSYSTPTPTVAALETRLTAIEDSLSSIDLLATEVGERNSEYSSLSDRIAKLEELLQGMSRVPELLGHQNQAIANLEERLAKLESAQLTDEDVTIHVVESDRFI